MNIFRNRAGLLGEFDTGNSSCSLQNIFGLVSEIKVKLSRQSYLLDNYLSAVLQTANITLAHNAADEGFLAGSTLHRLCTAALNHTETDDHPFYETVKLDFEKHHLKYQERQTQHCLHYISLADDFLKSIVPTFLGEQDRKLSSLIDTILPSSLFKEITAILNSEDQMVQLNSMLRQRFFLAPLADLYIQGFANDLLFCLNQRDQETSRQMFQLYLEEFVD